MEGNFFSPFFKPYFNVSSFDKTNRLDQTYTILSSNDCLSLLESSSFPFMSCLYVTIMGNYWKAIFLSLFSNLTSYYFIGIFPAFLSLAVYMSPSWVIIARLAMTVLHHVSSVIIKWTRILLLMVLKEKIISLPNFFYLSMIRLMDWISLKLVRYYPQMWYEKMPVCLG